MLERTRATIDLEAIVSNWKVLDELSGAAETAAVVKANAYGHGAPEVSSRLSRAGCTSFFTATVNEALVVRKTLGADPIVYVFNGAMGDDLAAAATNNLTPVINSLSQLQAWRASTLSSSQAVVLHIDTGMNRLGIGMQDIAEAKALLTEISVSIVMSHFACADEPDHPMNDEQRRQFDQITKEWPGATRSLSNSAGLGLLDCAYDLVRPGIALYGGGSPLPTKRPLQPAMTVEAPILTVFDVPAGANTGYGATKRFDTPRRLATVGIGYADGLPRSLSNQGFAYIGGERCEVVGRISMDLTTLDVTNVSAEVQPGVAAEFIGRYADLEQQAAAAGTLGYELLTGIGPRVERVWHG
ncbi:MAG: alanine racemase [Pseudomonadota bacterium]